jgi:hypothetical protein
MMTKIFRHISLAGLVGAALLTACDFEKNAVQEIDGPIAGARIKFFNFGVSAPGVNFYANDTKMTAISSATGNESTNGVTYGNAGAGAFYTAIAPGTYTIAGKIAATADKDLAISSLSTTIADGKYYSFYQSGIYSTATKSIDAFIVEDPIPALDFATAYVRFVNAISNSQPMVLNVTNTETSAETVVVGAVAYKTDGAFVAVAPGTYNLGTRVEGGSTNAISRSAITFDNGRVYTITARGNMTVATGTLAPFLDNTANR